MAREFTTTERIAEKLHRADQHIQELHGKLATFLGEAADSEVVHDDPRVAEAFADFQRNRAVDLSISIVAGEAIHQLRSVLDHLVCALIVKDGGTPSSASQFPIFNYRPTKPDDLRRYEAQIKGVTRNEVLILIETHQPYQRGNGRERHWLSILKRLNNADKHSSILFHLVHVQPRIRIDAVHPDGTGTFSGDDDGSEPSVSHTDASGDFIEIVNVQRSLAIEVAFGNWSDGKTPIEVSFGLQGLYSSVSALFSDLRQFL